MSTKGYAWNAKTTAKNSQNQYAWAQELFPKLKLQDNEALLDVGCGDGKIIAELVQALGESFKSSSYASLSIGEISCQLSKLFGECVI